MRRTSQVLCGTARVHSVVARAISAHAAVEMQQLYSIVDGSEVRSGPAKVISLAGLLLPRDAAETGAGGDANQPGGGPGGDREDLGLTMQAG